MYDKMLLTKIGSVVILISLFFSLLTSCKGGDDPFAAEPADTAADAVSDTAAGTAAGTDAVTKIPGGDKPDPDFYSLSFNESLEKYGLFLTNPTFVNKTDDQYLYAYKIYGEQGFNVNTLCRRKLDGTEWRPVCSDPLCTHGLGSGCPLVNSNSGFVCFGGKIYYPYKSTSAVYVYDPQTNKSSQLIKGYSDYAFQIRDGKLYVKGAKENPDLSSSLVFFRISDDGTYSTIGELDSWYGTSSAFRPIYDDRYIIDGYLEHADGSLNAHMKLRDIKGGGETELLSKVFENILDPSGKSALIEETITPCTIYGDKVLSLIEFHLVTYDGKSASNAQAVKRTEYHLTDIKTHEDEMILGTDDYDDAGLLRYTDKCIFYMENAKFDKDNYVIIQYDPFTGEKTSYNLTEAAEAAGFSVPEKCIMTDLQNGALIMSTDYTVKVNNNGLELETSVPGYALAYDLQSGRIFKYGSPFEDLIKELTGFKS